jgi:hypothetical protein
MSADRRRTRTLLLCTFLVFMLPVVAAWMLNIFAPDWRPFGTTNHGTLIQPVRSISADGLQAVDGSAMDPGYFSGRWTVVHIPGRPCAQPCIEVLTRSIQVRKALGEDMKRVQLMIALNQAEAAQSAGIPPSVTRVLINADWLATFVAAKTPQEQPFSIYLIDPQGYLMMRYPPDVEQRALLSDLKRLLKISKIG